LPQVRISKVLFWGSAVPKYQKKKHKISYFLNDQPVKLSLTSPEKQYILISRLTGFSLEKISL